MTIRITIGKDYKEKHKSRHLRHICLSFPTAVLKSKLCVKIIKKGLQDKQEKGKTPPVSPDFITPALVKTLYGALKETIRRHGHFALIDAESADGTKVLIRV